MPETAREPVRWGERRGAFSRLAMRLKDLVKAGRPEPRQGLPSLPVALQRGPLATPYLEAEAGSDHRRAGAAAIAALEQASSAGNLWAADLWGHRALWHFEQAEMELAATRTARLIGDVRSAGGDSQSARRYYAEAISEARDIGAEREEGLAALGLGRAHLQLGDVMTSRRLAAIAIDLLDRAGAPRGEVAAAEELRGQEKEVS